MDRKKYIAALLQLKVYSENELVSIDKISYNIDDELRRLGHEETYVIEITTTAQTTVTLKDGETLEQLLNRHSDVYLHGSGEYGWGNKEDIGGDTKIRVINQIIK